MGKQLLCFCGVTEACCVHLEGLEEVGRKALSGWGMECWVLRTTNVVAFLFCVLANVLIQGDNKWISHRKELFGDGTWDILNSLLGICVSTGLTAAVIMQRRVYVLPCFCCDISHLTRAPVSVFCGFSVFLVLLLSKLCWSSHECCHPILCVWLPTICTTYLAGSLPTFAWQNNRDKGIEISPTHGMVWQDWRMLAEQKEKLLLWADSDYSFQHSQEINTFLLYFYIIHKHKNLLAFLFQSCHHAFKCQNQTWGNLTSRQREENNFPSRII